MFSRLIGNMGGQLFQCKCLLKDVLKGVRSLLCLDVCLPYCGVVEFKRPSSDADLGLLMKVLHQCFHVLKLKNFALQFEKLWPQLWLAAPLPPRTGPALWIGFPFCFEGSHGEPSCLQIFLFVFWEKKKMFTLPSFKKNLKDKKKKKKQPYLFLNRRKLLFLAIHTEPLSVNVSYNDSDKSYRWAPFKNQLNCPWIWISGRNNFECLIYDRLNKLIHNMGGKKSHISPNDKFGEY